MGRNLTNGAERVGRKWAHLGSRLWCVLVLLAASGAMGAGLAPRGGATQPNGGWGPVWSPRGNQLAVVSSTGGLPAEAWVRTADGRSFRQVTHGGADELSWAKGGGALHFVTYRRGRAERWQVELRTGRESPLTPPPTAPAGAPWRPSPDGRAAAYLAANGTTRDLYLTRPGRRQPLRVTRDFTVGTFTWSPTGEKIAFDAVNPLSHGLPQVWVYDLVTKKLAHLGSAGSMQPVWSARGDALAYTMLYSEGGDYLATATPEGKLGRLYKAARYQGEGVAWSPRGEALAMAVRDGTKRQVWVLNRDGKIVTKLGKAGLAVRFPAWSPDGRRVACEALQEGVSAASEVWITDPAGKRWQNVTPSRPLQWGLSPARTGRLFFLTNVADVTKVGATGGGPVLPGTDGARQVAVSPAGDRLAVLTSQTVLLLSVSGRRLSSQTVTGAEEVQWSPRGDRLAVAAGEGTKAVIKVFSVSPQGTPAQVGSVAGSTPTWRPDGCALTFARGQHLWQADEAGEHPVQIAALPEAAGEEVRVTRLSYDAGSRALAAAVQRTTATGRRREVWVVRGKETARVYAEAVATQFGLAPERYGALPGWTAEGRVLFASDREGAPRVWSVAADGSGMRAVTPRGSAWAALAPDGRSLSFVRPEASTPLWKVWADGSGLAPIEWKQAR